MRISQMSPEELDGVTFGYVPPAELSIDPSLRLHRDGAEELDPVSFEVIRHSLFNVNEEHGATMQRISGSPVAIYALDLNPSILTEDGEFVYFGPYMQYMSGVTDVAIKWTLEHRSANPGIHAGDMFLCNDPWIGAAHQMDVILACPVFHEGELFCWVSNCLHQYDVGGITPGSFCTQAESVFDEGLMLPPVKIVEAGVLRKDIEDLYLRASRRPDMVALDLRAQIAGNAAARDRIVRLIERYGAASVKGAMRRIIDNGERSFLDKMARLPDGVWRDRTYIECSRVGDRSAYEVRLNLEKRGDTLIFDNEGTAAQGGAMNATYAGWRGSVMVALNQLLCWDQFFSIGGALRHVEFDPVPGTLNCATHPASVSSAPIQAMEISLYPTYNVLSKMIHCDPAMRNDIMCIGGTSQFPVAMFQGVSQHGEAFGYGLIDPIGGAIGAFATGDGISTGGQSRTPICKLPNIEHTEQNFPLLFLYRKELPDSGGPGRWRGGLSAESCWVPHNVDSVRIEVIMSGCAVPTSTGMMGGYPGAANGHKYVRATDVQRQLKASNIAGDIDDIEGESVALELREPGFVQTTDDVYAVWWTGAGGFGDPLLRPAELVQTDLDHDAVTERSAREIYGAVLDGDGLVDAVATEANRESIRRNRLERLPGREVEQRAGEVELELTHSLDVRSDERGAYHACRACGAHLSDLDVDYKQGCLIDRLPVSAAVPVVLDRDDLIDHTVEFRLFICPGCGSQVENEVGLDDSPIYRDIELRL